MPKTQEFEGFQVQIKPRDAGEVVSFTYTSEKYGHFLTIYREVKSGQLSVEMSLSLPGGSLAGSRAFLVLLNRAMNHAEAWTPKED